MIFVTSQDLKNFQLEKYLFSSIKYQGNDAILIQWNDAKRFLILFEQYCYENKIRFVKIDKNIEKIIIQKIPNQNLFKIIY